ncbi:Uncharacterised protein [Vibrio cholerae]|nr:Uncharacterised protein [Vibrio cholerae]CSC28097.1 Uncharacterised protein [Vibrio cholerae]
MKGGISNQYSKPNCWLCAHCAALKAKIGISAVIKRLLKPTNPRLFSQRTRLLCDKVLRGRFDSHKAQITNTEKKIAKRISSICSLIGFSLIWATSRIFTGAKALWSVKSQPFFRQ